MATKFTFPKNAQVGDRIEIIATSEAKLPIEIVGNSEAGKDLKLIFGDKEYTRAADGETVLTSITKKNIVYTFKCVSADTSHVWVLEATSLYPEIAAIKERLDDLESWKTTIQSTVDALEEWRDTTQDVLDNL
jgi:hypothetical protein